jgi:hypothetical protein
MVQSTQTRATSRINADGWVEIRDENGRLWCEYHPGKQAIRRYEARVNRSKGVDEIHEAEIAIDDLISGNYKVTLTRRPR